MQKGGAVDIAYAFTCVDQKHAQDVRKSVTAAFLDGLLVGRERRAQRPDIRRGDEIPACAGRPKGLCIALEHRRLVVLDVEAVADQPELVADGRIGLQALGHLAHDESRQRAAVDVVALGVDEGEQRDAVAVEFVQGFTAALGIDHRAIDRRAEWRQFVGARFRCLVLQGAIARREQARGVVDLLMGSGLLGGGGEQHEQQAGHAVARPGSAGHGQVVCASSITR